MNRAHTLQLKASVLPLAIVISALIALFVLGFLMLYESDFILFNRHQHIKQCRANVCSAYTLYSEYPNIIDSDSIEVSLYDSIPLSGVKINRQAWGLYEVITIASSKGEVVESRILGLAQIDDDKHLLYYCDNRSSLSLAGKTSILGAVAIPKLGVTYGKVGSDYFSGEVIPHSMISNSTDKLPTISSSAEAQIDQLLSLDVGEFIDGDTIRNSFFRQTSLIIEADEELRDQYIDGNCILIGDEVTIGSDFKASNIIISARKVSIADNFKGRLQVFCRDTIIVGAGVNLEYPSGLYSERYMEINDNSTINGYAVVQVDSTTIKSPNYAQSQSAKVRGVLYVDGVSTWQGGVYGEVYLKQNVHYTKDGYYKDLIYRATILPNDEFAYPLLFNSDTKRKSMAWVD